MRPKIPEHKILEAYDACDGVFKDMAHYLNRNPRTIQLYCTRLGLVSQHDTRVRFGEYRWPTNGERIAYKNNPSRSMAYYRFDDEE